MDKNYLEDFIYPSDALEVKWKSIQGQSSGISYDYFQMLVGDNYRIKPDRHILRFLSGSIGRDITNLTEAQLLISNTCVSLAIHHDRKVTPRELDHLIWNWQKGQ